MIVDEIFILEAQLHSYQYIAMGNNQSSNWKQEFQLIDSHHPIKRAIHRQTKQQYEILTLFPNSEQEMQTILNRIKLRTSKASPHLMHLHSFWKTSEYGTCSRNPSIDLIFRNATPLEDYLTYRRVKNERFSNEEVQYIIAKVASGLSDIREMKEEHGNINFKTVLIDHNVKLKDPFLVREEQSSTKKAKKINGFPSPQKLYTLFDTLSSFEQHTSDLFSLGILALQLIYPHQNLGSLYKNTNSRYLNCSININQLKTYIDNVQDYTLRNFVSVLTDEHPNKRREIHHLIGSRRFHKEDLRLFKQNPFGIVQQEVKNNEPKQFTQILHTNPQTHHHPTFQVNTTVDFPQRPKQAQSFIYSNSNSGIKLPEFKFQPISFTSEYPKFQPLSTFESQVWKPPSIVQPVLKNFREDLSESTPINKINGTQQTSFKSPTFDSSFPKISSEQSFLTTESLVKPAAKIEKVSPKFIDSTYRTSFLNGNRPQVMSAPLPRVEKHEELQVIIDKAKQVKQASEEIMKSGNEKSEENQEQLESHRRLPTERQQCDQPQVKTSREVQPSKEEGNHVPLNQQPSALIKFESVPTKIVESINEIEKEQKNFNQKEGFVVEEYDGGNRYEGFKKNGMRNGQGEFIYKEGSRYKGEWKDNKMEGYGTLYYPNGQVAYEGQWLDDKFHGLGTVYNDTPKPLKAGFDYTNFNLLDQEWLRYEGNLKEDSKEGRGILYLTNGEIYSGMFQNDYVNGEGEFKKNNGSIIKGIWQNGLLKKIIQ